MARKTKNGKDGRTSKNKNIMLDSSSHKASKPTKQHMDKDNEEIKKKDDGSYELLSSSSTSKVSESQSSTKSIESIPEKDIELLLLKNKHFEKDKVLKLWQSTTELRSTKYYVSTDFKRYEILELFVYLKESFASELVSNLFFLLYFLLQYFLI